MKKDDRKVIIHLELGVKYLCNWAVKSNPKKMTHQTWKVTCKNCKRIMKNNFGYGKDNNIT